jgi:hypothetical protein
MWNGIGVIMVAAGKFIVPVSFPPLLWYKICYVFYFMSEIIHAGIQEFLLYDKLRKTSFFKVNGWLICNYWSNLFPGKAWLELK